jgi:hypothetical protein
MIRIELWSRWLVLVAVFVILFGGAMALFGGSPFFDLAFNRQIDPAFWSSRSLDEATRRFQVWIYGAWGATVLGWGVILAFMAWGPFRRRERWAWWALLLGISSWYCIDTLISISHKVYFNAFVINTPLFLAALIPLLATRRAFQ